MEIILVAETKIRRNPSLREILLGIHPSMSAVFAPIHPSMRDFLRRGYILTQVSDLVWGRPERPKAPSPGHRPGDARSEDVAL